MREAGGGSTVPVMWKHKCDSRNVGAETAEPKLCQIWFIRCVYELHIF
jgi:hypothetical protein